jgi:two-component system, cell cycle sensor histidine kinase and response regulator CckA
MRQDFVRALSIRYDAMAIRTRRAPQVLIVDDDESVRALVARMLGGGGYDAVVASDGEEALRLVEAQGPFDGYVIDVTMPKMSGAELARRLRYADPDAKVLFCTGYSDRLFEERGTLWQHEAFIDKPFSLGALREAVSLLLFGHTRGPESGD